MKLILTLLLGLALIFAAGCGQKEPSELSNDLTKLQKKSFAERITEVQVSSAKRKVSVGTPDAPAFRVEPSIVLNVTFIDLEEKDEFGLPRKTTVRGFAGLNATSVKLSQTSGEYKLNADIKCASLDRSTPEVRCVSPQISVEVFRGEKSLGSANVTIETFVRRTVSLVTSVPAPTPDPSPESRKVLASASKEAYVRVLKVEGAAPRFFAAIYEDRLPGSLQIAGSVGSDVRVEAHYGEHHPGGSVDSEKVVGRANVAYDSAGKLHIQITGGQGKLPFSEIKIEGEASEPPRP